jgi:hypothetical protein
MLSALLSSRTPNFAQARYAEKYTFRDVEVSKVKFVLGVDRAQVCAQIHCMSTEVDDDDEEEKKKKKKIASSNGTIFLSIHLKLFTVFRGCVNCYPTNWPQLSPLTKKISKPPTIPEQY